MDFEEWAVKHGKEDDRFMQDPAATTAFLVKEDKQWLQNELIFRQAESEYSDNLDQLRFYLKGLIPVIGGIWICFTETWIKFGNTFHLGPEWWTQRQAIQYHLSKLAHL